MASGFDTKDLFGKMTEGGDVEIDLNSAPKELRVRALTSLCSPLFAQGANKSRGSVKLFVVSTKGSFRMMDPRMEEFHYIALLTLIRNYMAD
jgi:hypothetical protein